jgi:hypothetical protein
MAGDNGKPPLFLGRNAANGEPVFFSGEGALLTVGPPGTGKSRGVAAWNLLQYRGCKPEPPKIPSRLSAPF